MRYHPCAPVLSLYATVHCIRHPSAPPWAFISLCISAFPCACPSALHRLPPRHATLSLSLLPPLTNTPTRAIGRPSASRCVKSHSIALASSRSPSSSALRCVVRPCGDFEKNENIDDPPRPCSNPTTTTTTPSTVVVAAASRSNRFTASTTRPHPRDSQCLPALTTAAAGRPRWCHTASASRLLIPHRHRRRRRTRSSRRVISSASQICIKRRPPSP